MMIPPILILHQLSEHICPIFDQRGDSLALTSWRRLEPPDQPRQLLARSCQSYLQFPFFSHGEISGVAAVIGNRKGSRTRKSSVRAGLSKCFHGHTPRCEEPSVVPRPPPPPPLMWWGVGGFK